MDNCLLRAAGSGVAAPSAGLQGPCPTVCKPGRWLDGNAVRSVRPGEETHSSSSLEFARLREVLVEDGESGFENEESWWGKTRAPWMTARKS